MSSVGLHLSLLPPGTLCGARLPGHGERFGWRGLLGERPHGHPAHHPGDPMDGHGLLLAAPLLRQSGRRRHVLETPNPLGPSLNGKTQANMAFIWLWRGRSRPSASLPAYTELPATSPRPGALRVQGRCEL